MSNIEHLAWPSLYHAPMTSLLPGAYIPAHTCKKCGREKFVFQFRKHHREGPYKPWNLRICKECVHDEFVARYTEKALREDLKATSRSWKERNPKVHAEINKRWYHANKEKARASGVLRYAIKQGKIERMSCSVCGAGAQGHHDSYEEGRELDVRWLCQDHHKAWHIILDEITSKLCLDERFNAFVKAHTN